ncbi:hypothetical protein Adt_02201 [Abeliophyllum distichum]|uniref:Uncharacterized protein n=1 Tax=Abeliophyllum distichum TaxID=126358 RepID=A0ABD1VX30_9LAMI
MLHSNSNEPSQSEVLADESMKLRPRDSHRSFAPGGNGHPAVNGLIIQSQGKSWIWTSWARTLWNTLLTKMQTTTTHLRFPLDSRSGFPGIQGRQNLHLAWIRTGKRIYLRSCYSLVCSWSFCFLL